MSTRCLRCNGNILRDGDEWFCLSCGARENDRLYSDEELARERVAQSRPRRGIGASAVRTAREYTCEDCGAVRALVSPPRYVSRFCGRCAYRRGMRRHFAQDAAR